LITPLQCPLLPYNSTPTPPVFGTVSASDNKWDIPPQLVGYRDISDLFRDQVLSQFETQLSSPLSDPNTSFRTANSGINNAQVIYDGKTNEPVGILKSQNSFIGQFCYTVTLGDVIAYKLDHQGFAGVLPAAEMETKSGKGVIVKWIPDSKCNSFAESKNVDIQQRQAIAIFDLRVGNEDRNWCNIQIDKNGKLHPIDHDRVFYQYRRHDVCSPYSSKPLSKHSIRYINSLDINKDIKILRDFGIEENEIKNLVIRTTFLKLAARAPKSKKITLYDIEVLIEGGKLPSNTVLQYFHSWFYVHPWHKLINELEEPYSEEVLLNTFENEFYKEVEKVQRWRWADYDHPICSAFNFLYT
jgi:hypothetical protein